MIHVILPGQGKRPIHTGNGAMRTLAQSVYLSGQYEPPGLCDGLGKCGRCMMRFLPESSYIPAPRPKDHKVLSPEKLEMGWRLGCEHLAFDGSVVELPDTIRTPRDAQNDLDDFTSSTCDLAVDFGTTSIHYNYIDKKSISDKSLYGTMVNPQMGAGGDVMSRLAYALQAEGTLTLHKLSLAALRQLAERAGSQEICLAANPGMTYLVLGRMDADLRGLAYAPYNLAYAAGESVNLPGLPPLWAMPLIAPFIGGDISAGYAALAMNGQEPEYPFLLADLGTNGEFLLCLGPYEFLATSLPLGPALEGAGLSCGAEARPGVITGIALTPSGLDTVILGQEKAAQAEPSWISGTGALGLLFALRKAGIVDQAGHFTRPKADSPPLTRHLLPSLMIGPDRTQAFYVNDKLFLSASDIEALLKIRAAFSLALNTLLSAGRIKLGDLKSIYLAGTLGAHLDPMVLEGLNFLPPGQSSMVRAAGNTSLAGASLLLRKPELRRSILQWSRRVRTLNLAEQENFHTAFAGEMHL